MKKDSHFLFIDIQERQKSSRGAQGHVFLLFICHESFISDVSGSPAWIQVPLTFIFEFGITGLEMVHLEFLVILTVFRTYENLK